MRIAGGRQDCFPTVPNMRTYRKSERGGKKSSRNRGRRKGRYICIGFGTRVANGYGLEFSPHAAVRRERNGSVQCGAGPTIWEHTAERALDEGADLSHLFEVTALEFVMPIPGRSFGFHVGSIYTADMKARKNVPKEMFFRHAPGNPRSQLHATGINSSCNSKNL